MHNRVGTDDWDGEEVGEIMEAGGGTHGKAGPLGKRSTSRKSVRVADSVPTAAPRGGSDDGDDNDYVEVTLDGEGNVIGVEPAARGEDPEATPEKRSSSSYGHGVLRNASTRIRQASQQLRRVTAFSRPSRIDRSNSAAAHALQGLKFIARTASGSDGWAAAESCFNEEGRDGLLHRSKFAKCIGMKEIEFAGRLFDALARRRNIFGDTINKAQLLEFWKQISDTSFDTRLQTFFDMVDKNADGMITQDEIIEIIKLSASANKLTIITEQAQEYARLIMEELDPYKLGYIDLHNLKMLQTPGESVRIRTTEKNSELSEALLSQLLRPTEDPNPFRRWYRRASYFLADNWRRCWVLLLWLSVCAGLFGWKFAQYRRRAAFEVMGYCVCVAKGGAETLKFNMALVLLPVCRNTVTWLRSSTAAGRLVPFDDSLGFHKVVAAGIAVGAALHVVSHLACDFPRLLRASDDRYEPMKPFFGDAKPPSYWWFVKGTEGWTGLAMLVLMAIAFTLATPWFRRGKLRLSDPKKPLSVGPVNASRNRLTRFVDASLNRLTGFVDAALKRLTGFNAFWYTHHLFIIVYALLLVHGHFLYLTNKWQKKTVRPPPTEGQNGILLAEYDRDGPMPNPSYFPKVLIDGPYDAPAQDYKKYDVVLLVGLGIGATPMISIIKDIINNMQRLDDGDVESGGGDPSASAFRTRQAYFYWVTREQGSFEWFRGVLDEVAAADTRGAIELHNHCSSVYEEGDARSALIAMLQSLNHAKHGIDVVSGARVKAHFGRPDWRKVYERIALRHVGQRVGVFYCGDTVLTEKLRNLAKEFSISKNTKFEFHSENF